jgi:hypothetical protein
MIRQKLMLIKKKNVKSSKRIYMVYIRWNERQENDDKCKCRIGLKPIESA